MARARAPEFDPIAIFKALDRARVSYIVIGGLARVIQGTDELTDGVDVVPALREENLRRLDLALGELNARRRDGKKDLALAHVDALNLETEFGELKIVPEPAGTRGYDDLRRAASREHLGSGVRVAIASVGDLRAHDRSARTRAGRARPTHAAPRRRDRVQHRARARARAVARDHPVGHQADTISET